MLFFPEQLLPERMATTRKFFRLFEMTWIKIIEYVVFCLIVFLSVAFYHYFEMHSYFTYALLTDLTCMVVSIVVVRSKTKNGSENDPLLAECIWIFWIIYSLVFTNTPELVFESYSVIHSCLIIGTVIMTFFSFIKESEFHVLALLGTFLALLFFPHTETLFYCIDAEVATFKAIVFITAFVLFDNSRDLSHIREQSQTQLKIIRLTWPLIVTAKFLFFIFFLLLPVIPSIINQAPVQKKTILPVYNSDVKKESDTSVVDSSQKTQKRKQKIESTESSSEQPEKPKKSSKSIEKKKSVDKPKDSTKKTEKKKTKDKPKSIGEKTSKEEYEEDPELREIVEKFKKSKQNGGSN
jgi:hypothetical protein